MLFLSPPCWPPGSLYSCNKQQLPTFPNTQVYVAGKGLYGCLTDGTPPWCWALTLTRAGAATKPMMAAEDSFWLQKTLFLSLALKTGRSSHHLAVGHITGAMKMCLNQLEWRLLGAAVPSPAQCLMQVGVPVAPDGLFWCLSCPGSLCLASHFAGSIHLGWPMESMLNKTLLFIAKAGSAAGLGLCQHSRHCLPPIWELTRMPASAKILLPM